MSSRGFFEVHITTHQRGSSETNYRAVHKQMAAQGFERVIQTTAQIANEAPGLYRLHNAQLTMAQVVEMLQVSLAPLRRGMAVQVLKIDEEILLNLSPSVTPTRTEPESGPSPSSGSEAKAQSGYPAWRRPR
jgi:hypothetical protein